MMGFAAAKAVASSLLDLFHSHGGDGKSPTTWDVECDHWLGRVRCGHGALSFSTCLILLSSIFVSPKKTYCHLIDSHRHCSIHTRVVHGRGKNVEHAQKC